MTTLSADQARQQVGPAPVVVGTDGSPSAALAVRWAAAEAEVRRCPLTVVHVETGHDLYQQAWQVTEAGDPQVLHRTLRATSDRLVEQTCELARSCAPSVGVGSVVTSGDPREVLRELAESSALIVLGSRGRGAVSSLLLGSVGLDLTRDSACPVLVIRPREDPERVGGILCGTATTTDSLATIEAAFREADWHTEPLTLVHCRWQGQCTSGRWRPLAPQDAAYAADMARVLALVAPVRALHPDVRLETLVIEGEAEACLTDLSRSHRMLVLGRRSRTLLERVGSMSLTTSVVERAAGAVLVVP